MTTVTIQIPDREAQEVLSYIKQKGGKVIEDISLASVKRSQKSSLKKGLTEAILISRGDIKGTPLSQLWDE
jgi:hypothetical protein